MKVFHCIWTLGGGGAERQLSNLAQEQVRGGDEVHLAYVKGGPNLPLLQNSQVILHPLPANAGYLKIIGQLYRQLKVVKPDLGHTWLAQMDVLAGPLLRFLNIPWLMSERCSAKAYRHGMLYRIRSWVGRLADMVVANSSAGCDYWRGLAADIPSGVVRNGIDFEHIDAVHGGFPDDLASLAGLRVLLFAGRLDTQKNIFHMLEATAPILQRESDCRLLILGRGDLHEQLLSRIKNLHLQDRVTVLDYRTDLWLLMKNAHLFLSLSRYEGQPNTVLEAAAAGTGLVISDIPEHREFLSEQAAWWAPTEDVAAITVAIESALDDHQSRAIKQKQARQDVEGFSFAASAQNYRTFYQQLLQRKRFGGGN